MTEQALGKRAVETLDNGLVSVNLSAAAADVRLVIFHFFGYSSHKLAARVDLQHLGPSQRTAPEIAWKAFATSAESFEVSGSASL